MKAKSKSGRVIAEQCDLESCAIANALALLSGKWKPMIVWQLSKASVLRYGKLKRKVTGIAERVLIRQLKELEAAGIIHRQAFGTAPLTVEYSLTLMGKELLPIFDLLDKWVTRHGRQV